MAKIKAPLSYIYKNMILSSTSDLALSKLGRFSFVYKLEGDPYDLMPHKSKRKVIDKLTSLIIGLNTNTKIVGVPTQQNVSKNFREGKERVINQYKKADEPFELQELMEAYDGVIEKTLYQKMKMSNHNYTETYLIVQASIPSFGIHGVKSVKDFFVSEPLNMIQKLLDNRVRFTSTELGLLEEKNEQFLRDVRSKNIQITPVSTQEIVAVLATAKTRGISVFDDFKDNFILEEDNGSYIPYGHDLEPIFNARFSYDHSRVLTIKSEYGTSYQAFINIYQVPRLKSPGADWINKLKMFDFPIAWTMAIKPQSKEDSESLISSKKKTIKSEEENAKMARFEVPDEIHDSKRAISNLGLSVKSENAGLRQVATTFCLYADNLEVLESRVARVMAFFKDQRFKISRADNRIDLMNCYQESLLTNDHKIQAYRLLVPSINIGSTVYTASSFIGDYSNHYIGFVKNTKQHVFLDQAQAIFNDKSGNMLVVADLGGGKSFFLNLLAYLRVMHGGQAIQIDPKGGRSERFLKYLPELKGRLNIITIENTDVFVGVFDPFNIYTDDYKEITESGGMVDGYDLACTLASDILFESFDMDDKKQIILNEAFELMRSNSNKSMHKLVEMIAKVDIDNSDESSLHKEAVLFSRLVLTLSRGLGRMYFGHGTDEERKRALDFTKPWTVIETQNVPFPDDGKNRDEYTKNEVARAVINSLILNAVRTYAFSKRFNILQFDYEEAHVLKSSRVATATISQMVKMSRQLRFYINEAVHSLEDIPKELLNTFSYIAYFRAENVKEIGDRLRFIGLDESEENIKVMQKLESGTCILKDASGSIAEIRIDAVLPRLVNAFGSTPEQ